MDSLRQCLRVSIIWRNLVMDFVANQLETSRQAAAKANEKARPCKPFFAPCATNYVEKLIDLVQVLQVSQALVSCVNPWKLIDIRRERWNKVEPPEEKDWCGITIACLDQAGNKNLAFLYDHEKRRLWDREANELIWVKQNEASKEEEQLWGTDLGYKTSKEEEESNFYEVYWRVCWGKKVWQQDLGPKSFSGDGFVGMWNKSNIRVFGIEDGTILMEEQPAWDPAWDQERNKDIALFKKSCQPPIACDKYREYLKSLRVSRDIGEGTSLLVLESPSDVLRGCFYRLFRVQQGVVSWITSGRLESAECCTPLQWLYLEDNGFLVGAHGSGGTFYPSPYNDNSESIYHFAFWDLLNGDSSSNVLPFQLTSYLGLNIEIRAQIGDVWILRIRKEYKALDFVDYVFCFNLRHMDLLDDLSKAPSENDLKMEDVFTILDGTYEACQR